MKKVDKWTGEETVKISEIIELLNEIVDLDLELANKIVYDRFPCNHAIRDHDTIQAHCYSDGSMEKPKVGLLGILNGVFGCDRNRFGGITADIETETRKVNSFRLTDTDKITRQWKEKEDARR